MFTLTALVYDVLQNEFIVALAISVLTCVVLFRQLIMCSHLAVKIHWLEGLCFVLRTHQTRVVGPVGIFFFSRSETRTEVWNSDRRIKLVLAIRSRNSTTCVFCRKMSQNCWHGMENQSRKKTMVYDTRFAVLGHSSRVFKKRYHTSVCSKRSGVIQNA